MTTNTNLPEEYIIVFHFKSGVESSMLQSDELDKAKGLGLNITVLEKEVQTDEDIHTPSLYLVAAYSDQEPEVIDQKIGLQLAEEIIEWIKQYEPTAVSQ